MGYELFGEKIILPSAPVPGINNDQSLTVLAGSHRLILSSYILFKSVSTKK